MAASCRSFSPQTSGRLGGCSGIGAVYPAKKRMEVPEGHGQKQKLQKRAAAKRKPMRAAEKLKPAVAGFVGGNSKTYWVTGLVTFSACGPFCPWTISNSTSSPSCRLL